MNQSELLDSWLAEKRKLAPPTDFSQRVMAAVERSVETRLLMTKVLTHSRFVASQNVPNWMTSAAVLVCVMRTACFVQMLVEPTREYSAVVDKAISETPNVK